MSLGTVASAVRRCVQWELPGSSNGRLAARCIASAELPSRYLPNGSNIGLSRRKGLKRWLGSVAAQCLDRKHSATPVSSESLDKLCSGHLPPDTPASGIANSGSRDSIRSGNIVSDRQASNSLRGWFGNLASKWRTLAEKAMYNYLKTRTDTGSDLQMVLLLFGVLVLSGGLIKTHLVNDRSGETPGASDWWLDLFSVIKLIFGEEFPSASDPLAQQAFSVAVSFVGLAGFAMVLALVEQVVMENIETNVKRGGQVYESGHVLVLGWCRSARDVELVRKVVKQTCLAHAVDGGTTVVVLTQRDKLEMEEAFWRWLPARERHGSSLVFRQGSPLVPSDLRLVSARDAAAVVIISDQSRSAVEADAQSVRCAILLDELDEDSVQAGQHDGHTQHHHPASGTERGRTHIIVEMKTTNAMPLLKFACSKRVHALHTGQLNALRLAKMVKRPVISVVSQQLFNFENASNTYVQHFPELAGCSVGEVAFRFDDAIVLGVVDSVTGHVQLNPDTKYKIQARDHLFICRPTSMSSSNYHPMPMPVYTPKARAKRTPRRPASKPLPPPPPPHHHAVVNAGQPLVDASQPVCLPSAVGCTVDSCDEQQLPFVTTYRPNSTAAPRTEPAPMYGSYNGVGPTARGAQGSPEHRAPAVRGVQRSARHLPPVPTSPLATSLAPSSLADARSAPVVASFSLHHQQPSLSFMIPSEYLEVDESAQRVLVCGWGEQAFMCDLIRELDHGTCHLPAGSEVLFANAHDQGDSLGSALRSTNLQNITANHLQADPLVRSQLARVDLSLFRCAIILCDSLWMSSEREEVVTGIDSVDEPSVLLQDSLSMVVQLNIRKVLEGSSLPPINIISQKVASEGQTRFEDRHRLPLGISINFTSFAGKMLTQVTYNPRMMLPCVKLGESSLTIVDASEYAACGEWVSFFELMHRAQQAGDVLMGFYAIPVELNEPLETVVNPLGAAARSRTRVWNAGDGRVKFVVLRHDATAAGAGDSRTSSLEDAELEKTQQAKWVAVRDGESINVVASVSASV